MDVANKNSQAYDSKSREWKEAMSYNIAHLYLEKPAMKALIPDLQFKSVLCIGLGSGEELSEIIKHNPARIAGIDISQGLLNLAKDKYPSIEIYKMDMMDLSFPNESFDFIYSSLTFHYSHNWDILLSKIFNVLKTGGYLLFSTHNPDTWASKPKTSNIYTNERGITLTEHIDMFPGNVEVTYFNHLSVDTILEAVEHAGFKAIKKVMPEFIKPNLRLSRDDQEKYDSLSKKNSKTPLFLIVLAQK